VEHRHVIAEIVNARIHWWWDGSPEGVRVHASD
jgi:hypothetical protein